MATSRNPIVLALPPFAGLTRRLVLTTVTVFAIRLLLSLTAPGLEALLFDKAILHPSDVFGKFIFQVVTYSFISTDLPGLLFSTLSLWFFGSVLEGERGERWLGEYFFASTIGGALLSCILSRTLLANIADLGIGARVSGLWPAVLALILAYARFHADQELRFNFIFRLKAKYMAALYLLIYLALALTSGHRFDAMTSLCVALSGFIYLRFAPRYGVRFAASERLYGLRNAYYRNKRKRAAKKFTVYMRKQGKDVNLDPSGKYIPLDDEKRDPNDQKWMN